MNSDFLNSKVQALGYPASFNKQVSQILEEYAQYIGEVNMSIILNRSANNFLNWFAAHAVNFNFKTVPLDQFIGIKQSDFPKENFEIFDLYLTELRYLIQQRKLQEIPINKKLLMWIVVICLALEDCLQNTLKIFERQNDQFWDNISLLYFGRNSIDLKFEWLDYSPKHNQKFPWSSEEDTLLLSIIKSELSSSAQKRISWKAVSKELYVKSEFRYLRHGKQCRERWRNHLDTLVKKKDWSLEEDLQMLQMYSEIGRKWAIIAQSLKGRTDHSVKNRVLKLLKLFKIQTELKEEGSDKLKQVIKELDERMYLKTHKDTKTPIVKNIASSEEFSSMEFDSTKSIESNFKNDIELKIEQPGSLMVESNLEKKEHTHLKIEEEGIMALEEDNKIMAELIKLNIYELSSYNSLTKEGGDSSCSVTCSRSEEESSNEELYDFVQPEDFYSS